MIIDIHTHTLCPGVNDLLGGPPSPELIPYQRDMAPEGKAVDAAQGPELMRKFNDLETRLAAMDAMGVDFQIVAPAPGQQHYWAEAELLAAVSALQNDHVAALVAKKPSRFGGLGTLPLSAPLAAVAEATRAVEELGLLGFQIDSRADAMELSDPALDPVWARLAQLGAALVIHPLGFSHGQRFGDFFMVNTVGQPLEEIIAANHLIFGGILDRHPELRVLIVHGGGYFPFYLGRLDHAWKARPELRRLTSQPPSEYLRRMWYDTCVFDTGTLTRLLDLAGPDRVMMGSDWPFDMGDTDPVGLVKKTVTDPAALEQVFSRTARDFFGMTS
ncbi:amidohydrolase family protein [Roseibacterium sp. SDUM158016]|uniref:amidohydrolase family protein n=1 Tax=Roseicyclus sediminis TaxID=2980997 RepID=UPI0021D37E45|nr:amidohydrolase family protein [Roseibacterium sp. SDUM158016]MCU4652072.1 amidohydrolase family protein [Roseibacterium sp. SDUM158016]